MKLPRNRFSLLSALWFAGGIYALLKPAETAPPPFPHFDKAAHLALFFAQIWLLTKAFRTGKLPIPYRSLIAFALCFALFSECAQAWFTATRTGSLGDVLADMAGTVLALFAARAACRLD
ncbi:VanZ family protein [Neisseria polysaccharea]|uniref:VanZ family protein n=1 Tax=Neisseria polysaccharea TaxID=489 RepID=UPI00272C60A1|nr:VanZ family protein [Neisseria polysaccharea]